MSADSQLVFQLLQPNRPTLGLDRPMLGQNRQQEGDTGFSVMLEQLLPADEPNLATLQPAALPIGEAVPPSLELMLDSFLATDSRSERSLTDIDLDLELPLSRPDLAAVGSILPRKETQTPISVPQVMDSPRVSQPGFVSEPLVLADIPIDEQSDEQLAEPPRGLKPGTLRAALDGLPTARPQQVVADYSAQSAQKAAEQLVSDTAAQMNMGQQSTNKEQSAWLGQHTKAFVMDNALQLNATDVPSYDLTAKGAAGVNDSASQIKALYDIKPSLQSDAWQQAVAKQVLLMAKGNVQSASLRLNPPQMGQIEIKLALNQDQVSVSFSSAHIQVRDALEGALPRLREMFGEQGLNLTQADVSAQSGNKQRQANHAYTASAYANADSTDALPLEPNSMPIGVIGQGLVDTFA